MLSRACAQCLKISQNVAFYQKTCQNGPFLAFLMSTLGAMLNGAFWAIFKHCAFRQLEGCSTNGWPNQNQLRLFFRLITLSTFACVQIGIKRRLALVMLFKFKVLKLANKIREADIEASDSSQSRDSQCLSQLTLVYIRRIYTMTPKTSITRRRIKKTFLPHEIRWWPRRPRRG